MTIKKTEKLFNLKKKWNKKSISKKKGRLNYKLLRFVVVVVVMELYCNVVEFVVCICV